MSRQVTVLMGYDTEIRLLFTVSVIKPWQRSCPVKKWRTVLVRLFSYLIVDCINYYFLYEKGWGRARAFYPTPIN